MSRLQELMQELCPDGVEYKPLWAVTIWDKRFNGVDRSKQPRVNPHKYLLAKQLDAIEDTSGSVKLLTTGTSNRFTTHKLAGDYLKNGEIVYFPWGGYANIQYYDGEYVTSDNRIATSADTTVLDNRFLYHVLIANRGTIDSFYRGSALKHPNMNKVLHFRIPVPPIEVQREVVRVLDEYTAAHDELVAQLEQEMELRKQSDVLSYQRFLDEWIDGVSEVRTLKELVLPGRKISYGIVQPGEGGTGDLGVIRPVDIKNSRINVGDIKYVDRSKEDGYQKTKLQGGEILVVVRGTTGEIAIVPDGCKGMNVTRGIAVIATKDSVIDRDYLFDFLRGETAQRYIASNTRGTALRQINIADLEKLKVPVLHGTVREAFAESRPKAQSMTHAHHELIDVLSAEIGLANQQLALVRNQLLSFPERVA